MDFWERKDVNKILCSMTYHKGVLEAGVNNLHRDGTDNLYKFWKWQAVYLDLLDVQRAREKVPKPVGRPARAGRLPRYKAPPRWKHTPTNEKKFTDNAWQPIPLSWD
jgi:hypothetical protein